MIHGLKIVHTCVLIPSLSGTILTSWWIQITMLIRLRHIYLIRNCKRIQIIQLPYTVIWYMNTRSSDTLAATVAKIMSSEISWIRVGEWVWRHWIMIEKISIHRYNKNSFKSTLVFSLNLKLKHLPLLF